MDAALGTRIAAGVLVAAGLLLLTWSLAGIVLIATGVALLLLTDTPMRSGEVDHSALLHDLGLRGPGHHVPTDEGVRLFVPASAKGPYLVPELRGAVQRDPPGSIGLALDAPGKALLTRWAEIDALPVGQGREEVAGHLRRALPRLGLAGRVRVGTVGDAIRIDLRLRDPGPALEAEQTGWHMQGGCSAQSFCCAIAALAMAAPVRIAASRTTDDGRMRLEVVPCQTV